MRPWLLSPVSAVTNVARPPGRRSAGLAPRGLLAGLAAAGVLAMAGVPATAAAQPAGPWPVSATPARPAMATTVPLITGDQVVVTGTPGGGSSFLLRPAAGHSVAAVWYRDPAGDRFIIPAAALPYAGKELGMSLFDVSALDRDGITAAARIPVSLRFAPRARPAAPPGVTLTSVHGQSARGYLTAASARRFAAALTSQAAAGGGHPVRAGRLPGGLAALNLTAPGTAAGPRPRLPLRILRLKVTDENGRPANNAMVQLVNTDDIRREADTVPIVNGTGRAAVPAGDYSAFAFFEDVTPPKKITAVRLVARDDFKVPAAARVTTVSVAERSATSPISVTTARPAAEDLLDLTLVRFDAAGHSLVTGLVSEAGPKFPAPPVLTNAQPAAKVGRLHYQLQWGGMGTGPGPAYRYDVAFRSGHIPAAEHFTVRPGQFATVRQHFSADPAAPTTAGQLLSGAIDPATAPSDQAFTGLAGLDTETMPGRLTQYLGTADGGRWVQSSFVPNGTFFTADRRTFAGGRQYSLDWAHGPLAPGFGRHHGIPAPVLDPRTHPWNCLACAAGRTLSLVFSPMGDSELDHMIEAIVPASYRFTLYRNRARLFTGTGAPGVVVRGIPGRPARYRAVLDVSLAGAPGFSQSTATHTDLTVPYTPVRSPHATLPDEDTCAGQGPGAPCQILPALTLNYRLASNGHNTGGASTQVLRLRVVHVGYDGQSSRARVISAAVAVSFDGGTTWHRAALTGSNGHYTATWPNPRAARGTDPELRVTARDALGGSITQIITHAYTIAAASPRPR